MSLLAALGTVRKAQKLVFIRMCVSSCAQELHHTWLQLESPLSSVKRYAKVLLKRLMLTRTVHSSYLQQLLLRSSHWKSAKNVVGTARRGAVYVLNEER